MLDKLRSPVVIIPFLFMTAMAFSRDVMPSLVWIISITGAKISFLAGSFFLPAIAILVFAAWFMLYYSGYLKFDKSSRLKNKISSYSSGLDANTAKPLVIGFFYLRSLRRELYQKYNNQDADEMKKHGNNIGAFLRDLIDSEKYNEKKLSTSRHYYFDDNSDGVFKDEMIKKLECMRNCYSDIIFEKYKSEESRIENIIKLKEEDYKKLFNALDLDECYEEFIGALVNEEKWLLSNPFYNLKQSFKAVAVLNTFMNALTLAGGVVGILTLVKLSYLLNFSNIHNIISTVFFIAGAVSALTLTYPCIIEVGANTTRFLKRWRLNSTSNKNKIFTIANSIYILAFFMAFFSAFASSIFAIFSSPLFSLLPIYFVWENYLISVVIGLIVFIASFSLYFSSISNKLSEISKIKNSTNTMNILQGILEILAILTLIAVIDYFYLPWNLFGILEVIVALSCSYIYFGKDGLCLSFSIIAGLFYSLTSAHQFFTLFVFSKAFSALVVIECLFQFITFSITFYYASTIVYDAFVSYISKSVDKKVEVAFYRKLAKKAPILLHEIECNKNIKKQVLSPVAFQEGERAATTPPPSPFYHNDSKTPVSVSSIPRIQHDELPNGDNDSSRIASPQPKEDSGNPGPQNLGMPPPPRNN